MKTTVFFEISQLLRTKAVLITIQEKVEKLDIVEQCTQERQNTKWRFKLITNVPIFAALLKIIPKGCPDSVLVELLVKNSSVICLYLTKTRNHTKTIWVFSAHWPCT